MFILLKRTNSYLSLLLFSLSNANISMIIVMIFTLTYFIVFKITNINYAILFKIIHKIINCIILYTNMNIFHILYLHRNWLFLLYDTNPFIYPYYLIRFNKALYSSFNKYIYDYRPYLPLLLLFWYINDFFNLTTYVSIIYVLWIWKIDDIFILLSISTLYPLCNYFKLLFYNTLLFCMHRK